MSTQKTKPPGAENSAPNREEQLETAYTELWAATENGFSTDEFFKLRETYRNLMWPKDVPA